MKKQIEITDLKEGDKLYKFTYWQKQFFHEKFYRDMRQVTIKKVKNNRIYLKYGMCFSIAERDFNTEWFTSKIECYKDALEIQKENLEDAEFLVNQHKKEIIYLKKKIKDNKNEF